MIDPMRQAKPLERILNTIKVVGVVIALATLHCVIWFCDKCAELRDWFLKPFNPTYMRLALVYLLGFIALTVGWWVGFLGPLLISAGWVGKAVGLLVLAHIVLSFYIVHVSRNDRGIIIIRQDDLDIADANKIAKMRLAQRKHEGLVSWLDKVDASILGVGFLGKLVAIALVLKSVVTSSDPAVITAALGAISAAVSVALYSTVIGLALSMWTHCATLVVSNKLSTSRE